MHKLTYTAETVKKMRKTGVVIRFQAYVAPQ
jgi:hypothetical protein